MELTIHNVAFLISISLIFLLLSCLFLFLCTAIVYRCFKISRARARIQANEITIGELPPSYSQIICSPLESNDTSLPLYSEI